MRRMAHSQTDTEQGLPGVPEFFAAAFPDRLRLTVAAGWHKAIERRRYSPNRSISAPKVAKPSRMSSSPSRSG